VCFGDVQVGFVPLEEVPGLALVVARVAWIERRRVRVHVGVVEFDLDVGYELRNAIRSLEFVVASADDGDVAAGHLVDDVEAAEGASALHLDDEAVGAGCRGDGLAGGDATEDGAGDGQELASVKCWYQP